MKKLFYGSAITGMGSGFTTLFEVEFLGEWPISCAMLSFAICISLGIFNPSKTKMWQYMNLMVADWLLIVSLLVIPAIGLVYEPVKTFCLEFYPIYIFLIMYVLIAYFIFRQKNSKIKKEGSQ